MLLFSNILLLLVSAVTSRREFTIFFNRVAIIILLYSGIIGYDSLYITSLDTGIGIYNGLFHSTAITHSFDLFIYIIGAIILLLTAFTPRRLEQPIIPYNRFGDLKKNRLFSTGPLGYVKAYRNALMGIDAPQFTINPHFITGFVDGDGSFSISITRKSSGLLWKVQPIFTIGLQGKDLDLLNQIKTLFGVGEIYTKEDGSVTYIVGSLKDITNVIIPHLSKYPLITQKRVDFELFKQIVEIMNKGGHLTMEGLNSIVAIKASMDLGLSAMLKNAFPHIVPVSTPECDGSNSINSS